MPDRPNAEPDYYAVLGLPPDASVGEIEQAYRQLAGKRLNARWRTGRAGNDLALLNAAYGTLAYSDRRADYDRRRAEVATGSQDNEAVDGFEEIEGRAAATARIRDQQQLPRVQLGRPTSGNPADVAIIVLVVLFALVVGSLLASQSLVDLSFVQSFGDTVGLTPRRRPASTPTPATPAPAEAKASPIAATPTEQVAPLGALPTEVAAQRFAGSEVLISDPRPPRRSDVTVTLKLVRERQPVPNANVYLTAHYRTVDERQPPGSSTVRTDAQGVAAITFSVGDATPNYEVKLEVTALVEGQQVVFQASFTPR